MKRVDLLRKSTTIISSLILCIALSTIIYIVVNNNAKPTVSPENIELKELINSDVTQIKFSGKPTVLVFFTSWCPYCNEDAPKIVSLYEKYKDKVNIYGINPIYRDDVSEVEQYVKKYKIDYPVLLDETGAFYKHYGEPGFPTLYFIDSEGEVLDQIIGSSDLEVIESSLNILIEYF
ncbi:TlpA disulfide reductase family protein [Paenibacillus sp. FSL R5-0470]|uniref:TlpA family protein disulfide reductase n=1 Tax=Paenibacillus sp. FSL R5-0470 TaxID=2921641 RepID=UPI0030D6D36C